MLILSFRDIFPKVEDAFETEGLHVPFGENTINADEGDVFYEPSQSKSYGHGGADFEKIVVKGLSDGICFTGGETVTFTLHIHWNSEQVARLSAEKNIPNNIIVGMYIDDVRCNRLFAFNTFLSGCFIDPQRRESEIISFEIKMPQLASGDYFLSPSIALGEHQHHVQLKWVDQFGMIKATPKNAMDFLGFMRFTYNVAKLG